MTKPLMIYGVTGYTGRLVLAEALARGLLPILSGRSGEPVRTLATAHGLEARPVALDSTAELDAALQGVGAVLHCAGPFMFTSAPMVEACLRVGVHYLDITGELGVFERVAATDGRAKAGGVSLMPGVGFDVVPTDCLAAHLKRRLPSATRLELAFSAGGGPSHGTALTALEGIGKGGAIRREGRITRVPTAWRTRMVDFSGRERLCVSIPWGDVSTAWHSTAIPDIVVYMSMSPGSVRMLRLARLVAPLLEKKPVKRFVQWRIRSAPSGPSPEALASTKSYVWGEASDSEGRAVRSRLTTVNGYLLTAIAAVRAAERVLAGGVAPGFLTPSKAFGPDFVLEVPGTVREDLP